MDRRQPCARVLRPLGLALGTTSTARLFLEERARLARARIRSTELLALMWLALTACAAPPSTSWEVTRAKRLRAEGQTDAALRMTDRAIALRSHSPTQELVELHVSLLREQGRLVEALSYEDFAVRFFGGNETDRVGEELSRRDCGEHQAGLKLIHSWGKPTQGFWAIGVIVATFEIDRQGDIRDIVVHSARDPASAWGAIDSIARARVSTRRVAALYGEDPSHFPMALCLWRDFDPRNDPIPRDGTIRGGS